MVRLEPKPILNFTKSRCARLHGPLGGALERCIANQLLKTDLALLSSPFRDQSDRDGGWRGEFWGKVVRSMILAWRAVPEPRLRAAIDMAVDFALEAHDDDGVFSSYPRKLRLSGWDLWGRKYLLLGLERYYRLVSPSPRIQETIARILNQILTEIEHSRAPLTSLGNHEGLASCSLLGAVAEGWRITGERRFRDFALRIVESGCSGKHDIFTAARQGIPPAEIGNGKAYEMISCFKGAGEILELLPASYGEAVARFYELVRNREIFLTGTGGATRFGETWYDGKFRQTWPDIGKLGETCVTVSWIQFCGRLLRLSFESTVADELERAACNALLGGMVPDGSNWTHRNPTPLAAPASKIPADDQMLRVFGTPFDHHDCCRAQGPEGLAQMAQYAVLNAPDGIAVSFFEAMTATAESPSGQSVHLEMRGEYPADGDVSLTLELETPETFALYLRIPAWWQSGSTLLFCGKPQPVRPGSYCRLERCWHSGDRVEIHFDLSARRIAAFDGGEYIAYLCGPLVMAQDSRLGTVGRPMPDELPVSGREPGFLRTLCFSDGSGLCDYASAGNRFSPDHLLQLWLKTIPPGKSHSAGSPET